MVQDVSTKSVIRMSLQHYVSENSAVLRPLIILIVQFYSMRLKHVFACIYLYVSSAAPMRLCMAGACRSQSVCISRGEELRYLMSRGRRCVL